MAVGHAFNGVGQVAIVAGFDQVGIQDPGFGQGGRGWTSVGFTPGDNAMNAVVLQPDGKILAAGDAGNTSAMLVSRFTMVGDLAGC